MINVQDHYNKEYFTDYQKAIGSFGGQINKFKFLPYIQKGDKVIDFGCGGGYLLSCLPEFITEKIGIEINQTARDNAAALGLEVYGDLSQIQDSWADKIISNHVLEHTQNPFSELLALKDKLRVGGQMIFYVPFQGIRMKYYAGDVNQHLFTWNPMCLGNLFSAVGMHVVRCESYFHFWPPFYRQIYAYFGHYIFNKICRINGFIKRNQLSQIVVIAQKD